jgi:hypothetical protein
MPSPSEDVANLRATLWLLILQAPLWWGSWLIWAEGWRPLEDLASVGEDTAPPDDRGEPCADCEYPPEIRPEIPTAAASSHAAPPAED